MSTVLSLSRDHVSARLCPPPGTWAGTAPGGEEGMGKGSQPAPLSPQPCSPCHPSPTRSSGADATSGRDCPSHHLPGGTGNWAPLGASPAQREPTSARATSEVAPEHSGTCRLPPAVPRSTPPSSLHLYPSQSDLPSPSSGRQASVRWVCATPFPRAHTGLGSRTGLGHPETGLYMGTGALHRDKGSTRGQGLLRWCCVCLQVSLPGEKL